jgi:RimJ/RimL family protein N-acetyltransferase
VESGNLPVAQIRFQVSESVAVLGYLIDSNYRSKGLGTTILSKGLEAFTNDFGRPVLITGYVKHSNIASQRSFEKLKFTKTEATEYEASYKYTMQYDGN